MTPDDGGNWHRHQSSQAVLDLVRTVAQDCINLNSTEDNPAGKADG
jgi:hypothetical protein